jgi:hypothetical protein
MITINGNNFAETHQEVVGSLFTSGSTVVGFAKRNKRSIVLKNIHRVVVGVITKYGVLAAAHQTDTEGEYWYNHGDIKEVGDISCTDRNAIAGQLAIDYDWNAQNERTYIFK